MPFTDAYPVTLQSTRRENGYQTFAVGKMHVVPDRARFDKHRRDFGSESEFGA